MHVRWRNRRPSPRSWRSKRCGCIYREGGTRYKPDRAAPSGSGVESCIREKLFQSLSYNRLAVAPMMEWTDRYCRYFLRLISKRALLYTEMVTAEAIKHGQPARLLHDDEAEHPVALQLGGGDPQSLGHAARIGAEFGYDEINLNVGCPYARRQTRR